MRGGSPSSPEILGGDFSASTPAAVRCCTLGVPSLLRNSVKTKRQHEAQQKGKKRTGGAACAEGTIGYTDHRVKNCAKGTEDGPIMLGEGVSRTSPHPPTPSPGAEVLSETWETILWVLCVRPTCWSRSFVVSHKDYFTKVEHPISYISPCRTNTPRRASNPPSRWVLECVSQGHRAIWQVFTHAHTHRKCPKFSTCQCPNSWGLGG